MSCNDCIFCAMSRGDVRVDFLYLDHQIMVIRDINPRAPIHLLIIPRRCVKGLTYASGRTSPVLGQMFVVAEEMARREGVTVSGYRLVVNQGSDSGQELEHLHMHLLAGRAMSSMG